ncbi:hypothetical protein LTR91_006543 [Friedmanniomyces endolithicus]|uniref:F-box domain-containing protein n=1 Tax=Friedmanniomyces endolithicus TaxID=329885 RepID=A0AAN6KRK6_9PEZI|nr:hypothetical protein LTS00_004367 [Friedmanniomyces endolithicus]KAK0997576.1 hypothetical protein LTR91_006543 [Friedmanniomyces endolithicus]KAK1053012.1 hypothetical protein LTS16_001435 [Friedmanniomyces endolithicus]
MNNVQHLQREGRACYKRREYAKALEFFDSAIGRAPSVQLLDNRAACQDKLNDLPAALKDAKKAINLQKEDPTGYLRAGKILVKMERESVAVEIYSHGLKNVKHAGQGYELLRIAYVELMSQLSPPKSVDPLTVLPRELAEQILEYLTFQQRMNACLVSKEWTSFFRSVPSLWQRLDLSDARRKVRPAFISRAINDLTLLDTGVQSHNLVDLLREAAHLKALRILEGTQIGQRTLKQLVTSLSTSLETLVCYAPNNKMVDLGMRPYQRLTTLKICVGSFAALETFFEAVATCMPHLRFFTAHQDLRHASHTRVPLDLTALDKLECLDLRLRWTGCVDVMLPTTLRLLRLHVPHECVLKTSASITEVRLPRLAELSLDVPSVAALLHAILGVEDTDAEAEELVSDIHTLALSVRYVGMGEYTSDLAAAFQRRRLRQLKHLTTPHESDIDRFASMVAESLQALESIDVSGTKITGVEMKQLVGMPRLKRITVKDCPHLGRDAVQWARSQGVIVDDRASGGGHSGLKVRY